jgi:hypothetical protein
VILCARRSDQLGSDGYTVTKEPAMRNATRYLGAACCCGALLVVPALVARSGARVGDEKYDAQVPGGLAFSEFRGFENWDVISVSHGEKLTAVILGNPVIIKAFEEGVPENGKPFPDGAKMAKVHWTSKKSALAPSEAKVAGALHDVDFMVKDSKRFADGNGWGYAVFEYDTAAARYVPGTVEDQPPQENDAKCGAACHTLAEARDYVFTEYAAR